MTLDPFRSLFGQMQQVLNMLTITKLPGLHKFVIYYVIQLTSVVSSSSLHGAVLLVQ